MLHDILLIEEWHHQVCQKIFEIIKSRIKSKEIITISGESGSGKSELAHLICRKLKESGFLAKNISGDNFYKVPPKERQSYREKYAIEKVIGPDEYDWKLLTSLLDQFKNGKKASFPCIDLITDQIDTLNTDFKNVNILVFDGLYAIKLDSNYRIYIDITYEKNKKAQVLRNKETLNELRMKILTEEHKKVVSLKPLANIIVKEDFSVISTL